MNMEFLQLGVYITNRRYLLNVVWGRPGRASYSSSGAESGLQSQTL